MANATLVSQKVQEIHLSNKLEQAGQIQLDSSFSLNVSFANDGTRCVGKLTQTLRDKEFAGGKFTMSVELVGIFNCTGAVTDEVKRQVHGEVYDQLFPYMQSQCANLAGDWKLIEFHDTGEKELYNLREDPGETRNRIGDAPERAERLAEQLADWRREAEK